jgi:hypothetical protein
MKMSPVCQLQMTLRFPGGVGGDGSADERWGAIAAGSAARSGPEAVDDGGSGTAAGARDPRFGVSMPRFDVFGNACSTLGETPPDAKTA